MLDRPFLSCRRWRQGPLRDGDKSGECDASQNISFLAIPTRIPVVSDQQALSPELEAHIRSIILLATPSGKMGQNAAWRWVKLACTADLGMQPPPETGWVIPSRLADHNLEALVAALLHTARP